jgi:hypothetical protein
MRFFGVKVYEGSHRDNQCTVGCMGSRSCSCILAGADDQLSDIVGLGQEALYGANAFCNISIGCRDGTESAQSRL